jgi:hypothetical protein
MLNRETEKHICTQSKIGVNQLLKKKNPAILKSIRAPNALNTKNPKPPTKNNTCGKNRRAIMPISKNHSIDLKVIFKSFQMIKPNMIPKMIWIIIKSTPNLVYTHYMHRIYILHSE